MTRAERKDVARRCAGSHSAAKRRACKPESVSATADSPLVEPASSGRSELSHQLAVIFTGLGRTSVDVFHCSNSGGDTQLQSVQKPTRRRFSSKANVDNQTQLTVDVTNSNTQYPVPILRFRNKPLLRSFYVASSGHRPIVNRNVGAGRPRQWSSVDPATAAT